MIEFKDAVDKASYAMSNIATPDLPPLMRKYMGYLVSRFGMCGEVCMTAMAHYYQIVEKLPCNDDLYAIDQIAKDWFAENN